MKDTLGDSAKKTKHVLSGGGRMEESVSNDNVPREGGDLIGGGAGGYSWGTIKGGKLKKK